MALIGDSAGTMLSLTESNGERVGVVCRHAVVGAERWVRGACLEVEGLGVAPSRFELWDVQSATLYLLFN